APALAAQSPGLIFLLWKGLGNDTRMFWSTSNVVTQTPDKPTIPWSPQQVFPGATSHGPSMTTFRNVVFAAWKGMGTDTQIWFSSNTDGKTWAPQQQVPQAHSNIAPAIVATNSAIFVVWAMNDAVFWIKSVD